MSTSTITTHGLEMDTIGNGTRKAMVWSGLLHALLLLAMSLYRTIAPGPEVLTEITWIEPEEVQIAAVPSVPNPAEAHPVKQPVQLAHVPEPPEHFQRKLRRAEVEPRPQTDRANTDRIRERLASLQQKATAKPAKSPALMAAAFISAPQPSLASPSATSTVPALKLTRTQPTKPAPLKLKRTASKKPSVVAASVPIKTTPSKTKKADYSISKTLAGTTIMGPVADRSLLAYTTPDYPDWAKREAVEGSVRLYFVVRPDGGVKENVLVQKTSGYKDFDKNATNALLAWQFERLSKDTTGEQWGEITFHYQLNEGNGHE